MGVEEDILTAIAGVFVFVMGDGSRTVGVEEDILTAIAGVFVFLFGMGVGLWVWRRTFLLPLLEFLCFCLRWE